MVCKTMYSSSILLGTSTYWLLVLGVVPAGAATAHFFYLLFPIPALMNMAL